MNSDCEYWETLHDNHDDHRGECCDWLRSKECISKSLSVLCLDTEDINILIKLTKNKLYNTQMHLFMLPEKVEQMASLVEKLERIAKHGSAS